MVVSGVVGASEHLKLVPWETDARWRFAGRKLCGTCSREWAAGQSRGRSWTDRQASAALWEPWSPDGPAELPRNEGKWGLRLYFVC